MMKVIVLDGKIINVGDWDFQYYLDENEERVAGNPMPDGATTEEREMEYSELTGWVEVGLETPPTESELQEQRLSDLELIMTELLMGGMI